MSERLVWWLEDGTETCRFCGARYAYEVERRCTDCDRPMCPWCVVAVRERVDVRCIECRPGTGSVGAPDGGGSGADPAPPPGAGSAAGPARRAGGRRGAP